MSQLIEQQKLLEHNLSIDFSKKVVGLVPDWRYESNNQNSEQVPKIFYFEYLLQQFYKIGKLYDVEVFVITYSDKFERIGSIIDGLIIPGGRDIDPKKYGEPMTQQCNVPIEGDIRYEYISSLYNLMLQQNKAILGICWGMQFLNVFHGGTLVQDISDRCQHNTKRKIHLKKSSWLHSIMSCFVYGQCFHHQLVKKLSKDFEIMALDEYSKEIHSIFLKDKNQFVLGVQWHPEMTFHDEEGKRIDPKNLRIFEEFFKWINKKEIQETIKQNNIE